MRVHHLNISCRNIDHARTTFTEKYNFNERGWLPNTHTSSGRGGGAGKEDRSSSNKSYVLVKGEIFLILVQDDGVLVDTINDISFQVESVPLYCSRVVSEGGTVVEQPCFIDCMQRVFQREEDLANSPCSSCEKSRCRNFVQRAVVKSPVGNITHTLLDTRSFSGYILPGFVAVGDACVEHSTNHITRIDHVALAVGCGETGSHIAWYERCLQMNRFKTNVTETKSGLLIRGRDGNGLRMLTLSEHPCSDVTVGTEDESAEPGNELGRTGKEVEVRNSHVKFVFVESLLDEGSDQVQIYLRHHGGPGVQHVAFYTKDITTDANTWMDNGVNFIRPPVAYYREIQDTLRKLEDRDVMVTSLQEAGILVDCEKREGEEEEGYLYQVFTEPVFDSRTFFFELIQRDNARGFGAGNVRALWRALDSRFQTMDEDG